MDSNPQKGIGFPALLLLICVDARNQDAESLDLLTILSSYETVLSRYHIKPEHDLFYYRFLLKLNMDLDPNWFRKLEKLKMRKLRKPVLHRRRAPPKAQPLTGRRPHHQQAPTHRVRRKLGMQR